MLHQALQLTFKLVFFYTATGSETSFQIINRYINNDLLQAVPDFSMIYLSVCMYVLCHLSHLCTLLKPLEGLMPFGRDIIVVPNNTVLDGSRSPTVMGDLGSKLQ